MGPPPHLQSLFSTLTPASPRLPWPAEADGPETFSAAAVKASCCRWGPVKRFHFQKGPGLGWRLLLDADERLFVPPRHTHSPLAPASHSLGGKQWPRPAAAKSCCVWSALEMAPEEAVKNSKKVRFCLLLTPASLTVFLVQSFYGFF